MKTYLFIFFLFFLKNTFSQNHVFDAVTNKAIPAVNIFYSNNMGLISNEDGYFNLPKDIIADSLQFSHLSYKTKKILLNSLKKNDTIFLETSPIELEEIVLNNINSKDIVIKAINKIDENYIQGPYNLFGFLRQSLQEDGKGVEMIEVEFIGYLEKQTAHTEIVNARRTENHSKFNLKTSGGVSVMIEDGDFVRRKAYFLDIKNINDYKFIYEGQIEHENLRMFKISFMPVDKENLNFYRKGVLYIDSKSFAIAEIRYTFDKEKLSKISKASEKNISKKEPYYRLINVENLIKYKQLPDKKWSISYFEGYNLRKGIYKSDSYNYNLTSKLIINNVKTNRPIKVNTNYSLKKDFNKAVKKFENMENWGDNYKLSLSNEEKQILNDIEDKQNKN